ncbi:MAG: ROK family protein [Sarcina sp.]
MKKIVCIDVGGTFIKHGILDEKGNILEKGKDITDKSSRDNFIALICRIVDLYKHFGISGVSLSIPGFVDTKRGVVTACSEFRFLENYELANSLLEIFDLEVKIENDANCVVLAEKFSGNAIECDDFVCITIGTGIGGGLFVNGNIVRGKTFSAGEFCYMITKDKKGYQTLKQNSAMTALSDMYKDYKGIKSEDVIHGKEIFYRAINDDGLNQIISQWYSNIARMILNIASVLNPEKVLIGGGISSKDGFVNNIEIELEKIPQWKYVKCKIETCKYYNDAGMIGSAYNFWN